MRSSACFAPLLFLLCLSPWPPARAFPRNPVPPSIRMEDLPGEARAKLRSLGFVVLGEADCSMEGFYTWDPYSPKFLTTDMFWELFQRYTSLFLYWKGKVQVELLRRFSRRILDHCRIRRSGPWEGVLYFFAPSLAVLEPGSLRRLPAKDREKVQEILSRMEAGKPFHVPHFSGRIDPKDFVPRWIYARDPFLRRYFKATIWYKELSLDLKKEEGKRLALLLTREIFSDAALRADYLAITGFSRRLFGIALDLGPDVLAKRLEKALGKGWTGLGPDELWRKGRKVFREPMESWGKMGWDYVSSSFSVFPGVFPPDTLQMILDCEPFIHGRAYSSGLDLVGVGPVASEEGRRLLKREFSGNPWLDRLFRQDPVPVREDFYGLSLRSLGRILEPWKEAPPLFSSRAWRKKEVWTQLGGLALLRRCGQPKSARKRRASKAAKKERGLSPLLAPYPAYYRDLCLCFSRMARFTARWEALLPRPRTPEGEKERKRCIAGMEKARRAFRAMENSMARLSVLAEGEWSPQGPGPGGEAFLREFPKKAYGLLREVLPPSIEDTWDGPMTFSFPAVYGGPKKGSFYFGVSRPHLLLVLLPRKGKRILHKGLVLGYREGPGPFGLFDPPMEKAPLSYPRFTRDFRVEGSGSAKERKKERKGGR